MFCYDCYLYSEDFAGETRNVEVVNIVLGFLSAILQTVLLQHIYSNLGINSEY